MRSLFSLFLFLFAAVVSAISASGNRLLVILDDVADKANYSKFLGDLESLCLLACLLLPGPVLTVNRQRIPDLLRSSQERVVGIVPPRRAEL
jgi:hypothetical protein